MSLDRTVLTLATAALLGLVVGAHRPQERLSGVIPELMWIRKVEWPPRFDVVVAGASRVLEGVSPEEMATVIPGVRVANFGFGHTGLDARYLAAARRLLAPDARDPALVLSIHPVGLSVHSSMAEYSDFHKWSQEAPLKRRVAALLAPMQHFFRPIGTRRMREAWAGRDEQGHRIITESGWINAAPIPEDPGNALRFYPLLLHDNPVSEQMIQDVMDATRGWRAEGIRVFGFRPPITPELAALELEWTGFDYPGFIRGFREAGGSWLDFDHSRYHSYDGSHMREDSARLFSRELAHRLAP